MVHSDLRIAHNLSHNECPFHGYVPSRKRARAHSPRTWNVVRPKGTDAQVPESPRRLDKTHKARHFPSVNTALEPFASAYASENRMVLYHSSVRSGG